MSENEQRTFKRSRTLVKRDVAGTCLIAFLCVKLAFSTDGLDEFYAVLLTRIKSNQIFNCYLLCGLSRLEEKHRTPFCCKCFCKHTKSRNR